MTRKTMTATDTIVTTAPTRRLTTYLITAGLQSPGYWASHTFQKNGSGMFL
jgi:hypothetical protein